jgi:site-specific recombinase XerD
LRRDNHPHAATAKMAIQIVAVLSSRLSRYTRMIERAAGAAGLELKAHPHMLRHACGYALANKGHDTRAIQAWLGHRSITSTAIYTALAPNRFKDFWRD